MFALLALLVASMAADPTHEIVPEDHFSLDSIGRLTVSPDGSLAVFGRTRWPDGEDKRRTDLWQVHLKTQQVTRLTWGDSSSWAPTWSPDGQWLYFKGRDDHGNTQVFRLGLGAEAPIPVTTLDDGIDAYQLSADGAALWFLTSTTMDEKDDWADLRGSWSDVEYVDRTLTRGRVHRLDLATWRTEEVVAPSAHIMEFAVSPDERRVAMLTAPDGALVTHEGWSKVTVHDREFGQTADLPDQLWRDQAPSPYGWLLGLAWSDDSEALAFRIDFDGHPGDTYVAEVGADKPVIWPIPREGEFTPHDGTLTWRPGSRELCLLAEDHARVRVACVDGLRDGASGRSRAFPQGDVVVDAWQFTARGKRIVAEISSPEHFGDLFSVDVRTDRRQRLTDINPQTADWILPKLQLASWTSPDGTPVEGVLELPPHWTPADGPLPTLVLIHGGPTAATPYSRRFRQYGQTAFAAKGWAVISPNYRGSTGFGDSFITDLVGHENDVDVADILAGVDALVAEGIADPERLGVTGWSNGGYLTNCLISQTDRFKGASSGAGVFDQTIQWATEDTPGHVVNFMEGLPWEQPEEVQSASPLFSAGSITTPTLIHVGEHDPRVPPAHARALHRALSIYLEVPSELIVYPGAGHGLSTRVHRQTKMAWDHAWMGRWVLGEEP